MKLLELKNSMNVNRIDLTMPLNHVRITEYYILGFGPFGIERPLTSIGLLREMDHFI